MSGALGLVLALGCAGPGHEPAQAAPTTPQEPAAEPAPAPVASPEDAPAPAPVVGAWTSEACGERTWTRALQLDADGAWRGRDLVSPCPEGVTCVWSGVVERSGAWRPLDGAFVLEPAADAPGHPAADPAPTRLVVEGEELVDDLGCRYQRAAALP